MVTSKSVLRQEFRGRLRAMREEATVLESEHLRSMLQEEVRIRAPQAVAAFWPIAHEPDLVPLLNWLRVRTRLLLPRIAGKELIFHQVEEWVELIEGPYGTREPNPMLPRLDPVYWDMMLVPGVAFTMAGERLGRGGGFYDRCLARLTERTLTLGVAFTCQIAEVLPMEVHDQRVGRVVTGACWEKGGAGGSGAV